YQLQQSTPGMVIIDVTFEVLGQIVDAFRKYGHLHFRRSGIAGLGRIGLDDFRLACGRNRHRAFLSLTSLLPGYCAGAAGPGSRPPRSPDTTYARASPAYRRDIGTRPPGQARRP